MNSVRLTVVSRGAKGARDGGLSGGMGSAPLPLQRGWDTLKISPRQLIRERQAVAAEMFVVVRLFWLQQAVP